MPPTKTHEHRREALARWAMHQSLNPLPHGFAILHQFAQCGHDVNWSWMQTTHPAVAVCFPPLQNQQVMHSSSPDRFVVDLPHALQPEQDAPAQIVWQLHLKSANALASEVWDIHSTGSRRTGQRTLRLDQQWHSSGTHVIGGQEARTPQGKLHSPQYLHPVPECLGRLSTAVSCGCTAPCPSVTFMTGRL